MGTSGEVWGSGSNWSDSNVPNAYTEQAIIDNSLGGGASVILNGSFNLGGLDIASGFTLTRAAVDTSGRHLTLNAATDTYFSNAGSIISGGTSGTLTLEIANTAGTVLNTGLMEASNGSELNINSAHVNSPVNIDNTGGTIRTVGSGILQLGASDGSRPVYITGGLLQNTAGTINHRRVSEYTDVTITNSGTYNMINETGSNTRAAFTLFGTSLFTNSGTLNITRDLDAAAGSITQGTSLDIKSTDVSISNSGTINLTMHGSPGSGGGGVTLNINETSEITNTESINLISESSSQNVGLLVSGNKTATFSGTGELVMTVGTGGNRNQVSVLGGNNGVLLNGSGHTFRGAGTFIQGHLTNQGTLLADNATHQMVIDLRGTSNGLLDNSGTLRASGAAGMDIQEALSLSNSGTIQIDQGSTMSIGVGVSTVSSTGTIAVDGALNSENDIAMTGGSLNGGGSITGNLVVDGGISLAPTTVGGGSLTIDGNLTFAAASLSHSVTFDETTSVLSLTGNMAVGAGNSFDFTFGELGGFADSTTYTLFDVSGTNGIDLTTLTLSSTSQSAGFVLDSGFGTDGWNLNGENLEVRFATVIPEPSTFVLILISFVGLWVLRFKRS